MNFDPHQSLPRTRSRTSNASWLLVSAVAILLFTVSEFFALLRGNNQNLGSILPIFIAGIIAYWFVRTGRQAAGSVILMSGIGLQTILLPLVQSGVGVPGALTAVALIGGVGLATLPRNFVGRVLVLAMIVAVASILIDLFGSPNRPPSEFLQGRWVYSLILVAIFSIFFAREFLSLDIRAKIVLAILTTGGISLGVLSFFAIDQTRQITGVLSERLDTSVRLLSEEQLVNTAFIQADSANQSFEDIAEEVVSLAHNWISLQTQQAALSQNVYWDARANLVQLDGGQYGNSPTDPSSVFVPVNQPMDESLMADLNLSAYLDFYAPGVLETHSSLLAIYAIDTRGVTRYYPNIDLASLLPPDFDATQRPYFEITGPLFNPQRLARWTIPYVDATGGGLVVTVAAPVYRGDRFSGVVAADMQLVNITEQISAIKIGQTGYAFLIDDAGRILSMPPAGFDLFGVRPEDLESEEFFKQTLLGSGTDELQSATRRMVAGGSGLLIANVNGVDTYISYAPIKANGYSVALVVPVSELQGAIATARAETQQQVQTAIRTAALILTALLIVAVAVSLGLGRVIATPIQRLTLAASQIASGNLVVQTSATTNDEIGTLADAFNTMTSRLRETLDGLEQRVQERTAELQSANERNERRAKRFESIARVAHTISSTRELEKLLNEITSAIYREFGFYHVGIFLLDTAREYAVLSAANSLGGEKMLARGHRLKVGETSIVGYATSTGRPRVALDTGADAVYFDNPDLPETRSEAALPLHAGQEIIGALDVQSVEANAFTQEDISILLTLADQVSIAIQNARQFEETRRALNESESLSRQFIQAGWQQFTKTRNLAGIRHTGTRATLLYRKNDQGREESPSDLDQARVRFRGALLSLPVKLRGEVIGSVDVRTADNRQWDQDELDIVTAIIERAAIAMENARLLAESQKRASKERTIGEISSKISMQSGIDELLKTAAQELGRTLPGAEISIQFNKDTE